MSVVTFSLCLLWCVVLVHGEITNPLVRGVGLGGSGCLILQQDSLLELRGGAGE